ncbi:hypothetical protein BK124_12265 [Paenibacillus amylolyticus]|uniref:hypothetical protein n=1 Tax=Paenibacillus amylolyticus TaxID=1451 RepID=UPI00096D8AC4|nr:hypothetical protein [Paenibacillus amylolyticus]OME98013.1 hypothetical protein BK124_12265 [Paenibacillus amylolyticus]
MAKKSKRTIPALMYQYQGPQRNVGFVLSPLYIEESVEVEKEDMLFIYNEDFDYIRPALDRAFPLTDPRTGEEMKAFDPCWENPITKVVWVGLLSELDQQVVAEPELRNFLNQFIAWVRNHLQLADGIEVTGNL